MAPSDRVAEIITGLRRDGYSVSAVVEREWLDVGVVSYALASTLRGAGLFPDDLAAVELPTREHYCVVGSDVCVDLARLAYDYWQSSGNVIVSEYCIEDTRQRNSCATRYNFRALVERYTDPEEWVVLPLWVRYNGLSTLLPLVLAQAWSTAPSFVEWIELLREALAREDRDIPISRQVLLRLVDLSRFENHSEFRRWR